MSYKVSRETLLDIKKLLLKNNKFLEAEIKETQGNVTPPSKWWKFQKMIDANKKRIKLLTDEYYIDEK